MSRHAVYAAVLGAAVAGGVAVWLAGMPPSPPAGDVGRIDRPPRIRPDYAGVTIPPNIAPLNFVVDEEGDACHAVIRGADGTTVEVAASGRTVSWPPARWRRVLEASRGRAIAVEATVRGLGGRWRRFAPFAIAVAPEPIDGYLAYRLLRPLYNNYVNMGIYQRDLTTFAEWPILENRAFDRGCLNCHTFNRGDPGQFFIQTRGPHGPAMLLVSGGRVTKVDTRTAFNRGPAAYASWHPSGRLIAFSVNQLSQFFHTVGENRDVFDADSNLGVYRVDVATVTTCPDISLPDRNETWPAWSADGRRLYYSSAPKLPREKFAEVRYDLMCISYEEATGTWGRPRTLLSAAETGLSLQEPRPSPDGRWVLVTASRYGNFPIYQPSADLLLVDAATGRYRRLECNSDACDSFHSWSSDGRWIVFSSKRGTGLFARPHFAYIDAEGRAAKPFVLPQKDPTYYDSCLLTYNAPELVRGPASVGRRELVRVLVRPGPGERIASLLDPALGLQPAPSEAPPEEPMPYAVGGRAE